MHGVSGLYVVPVRVPFLSSTGAQYLKRTTANKLFADTYSTGEHVHDVIRKRGARFIVTHVVHITHCNHMY
jgi:hypothetical protein